MNQQVDIDAAANFREYELTLTVDPGASASVAVAVCRKKELAKAFAAHRLAAEKAERERIVAWLRTYPSVIGLDKMSAWNTAAHIERGEHER